LPFGFVNQGDIAPLDVVLDSRLGRGYAGEQAKKSWERQFG
jgi:hypothetical protein